MVGAVDEGLTEGQPKRLLKRQVGPLGLRQGGRRRGNLVLAGRVRGSQPHPLARGQLGGTVSALVPRIAAAIRAGERYWPQKQGSGPADRCVEPGWTGLIAELGPQRRCQEEGLPLFLELDQGS